MKIKFKDGKEIEFKQFEKIWLAESVIWEKTELHRSLKELRELKAEIAQWFAENAPEELKDKFEDKITYREGRTYQVTNYFLGDEDRDAPIHCRIGISDGDCCSGYYSGYAWDDSNAVRLCLEEKK